MVVILLNMAKTMIGKWSGVEWTREEMRKGCRDAQKSSILSIERNNFFIIDKNYFQPKNIITLLQTNIGNCEI